MKPLTVQQSLRDFFSHHDPFDALWLAVSGGADSIALLHAVASIQKEAHQKEAQEGQTEHSKPLAKQIRVIHVHHGLHPDANSWCELVEACCKRFALPLEIRRVQVTADETSLETAARHQRYRCFAEVLSPGSALLTAHHQDDQAETVLLHMMRGAGLRGLAGIPDQRPLGKGLLLRPLLSCARDSLVQYCHQHQLTYVVDPSNEDLKHRRNFIRHEILPRLAHYWPEARQQLSRTAGYLREYEDYFENLESEWLAKNQMDACYLPLEAFFTLNELLQRRMIQAWVRQSGAPMIPRQQLTEYLNQIYRIKLNKCMESGGSNRARLDWLEWSLIHYNHQIHLLSPAFQCQPQPAELVWQPSQQATLSTEYFGRLTLNEAHKIPKDLKLTVRFRSGGEKILQQNGHHVSLKQVLNTKRIPPWLRNRVPLLYMGDCLWAIADLVVHPKLKQYIMLEQGPLKWSRPNTH